MPYTGYTEAHKAANKHYNKKQERIYLMVAPETKERIKKNARQENKSTTAYILNAIEEYEDDLFCEQLAREAEKENDGSYLTIEELAEELGIELQDNH